MELLVANEMLEDRADLLSVNFPETDVVVGDIREVSDTISKSIHDRLEGRNLDILFATPPCQGMSKNGRGKLLRGVRDGLRDAIDPRNQLATYVPPLAEAFSPRLLVFENVPEMDGTLVEDSDGELVELLDHLESMLVDYSGCWKVIEFADYGVPQRRQRLITVFLRNDVLPGIDRMSRAARAERLFPRQTHAREPNLLEKDWLTVTDTISDLPSLDARSAETARDPDLDFHYVPVLDERKYWWVSHTALATSAFDNQCVAKECGYNGNATHASRKTNGVNRASTETPIYCSRCGALLPRPVVETEHGPRLMKGFTSAYKRMRGDLPSAAMTRNLSYACSDQKLHPTQNRVLSLLEAMRLQTITDYPYRWTRSSGKRASDKLVRDAIGESVPPRGLEVLFRHLITEALAASVAAGEARG